MGIIVRQAFKATAVHYVGALIGIFVSLFLQTKCLTPDAIGLTRALYTIAEIFSLLALLGAGSVGMRFFPYFKDEASGNHGFFYYFRLMPIVGTLFFTLVFLLFQSPIEQYFSDEKSALLCDYIYYAIPLFWVLVFWQFFEAFANINMRIAVPKGVREIGMRLMMVGIFVAFYKGWIGITGLIVAYIVGYGICMTTVGIYSTHIGCTETRHDWSFITPDLRSKVLKYSGFLTISAVSGTILGQLDLIMLTSMKGLYDTGVYAIVLYMAEVVNMPSRSITPISAPIAAQAIKDNDTLKIKQLYQQVSVHQTLAASVLLLFVWVNLDNIFAMIPNGETYAVGKWAVLLLGMTRIMYGMLNFGNTLISFSKYYYWTLVITIVLIFFSIGTNLFFIPLYGLNGAALATLIALSLSYIFQQALVQWKMHCHPFTWRHLLILAVVAILYVLNWLIPNVIIDGQELLSAVADCAVRSSVLAVVAVVLIYTFHISAQVNNIVDKNIAKFRK
ncbi:MAG: hypothetical protein E7070_11995 [Bacteroidales bacterium]|nr:hypothetical protein [Bacteroidales bacterium]